MNNTSKLDTLTNSCGEIIKLANMIVENNSKSATITLLKKISEIINNHNYKLEIKKTAQLVNSSLIEFYGYLTIKRICKPSENIDTDRRTLQDLLDELNSLIGLEKVKNKVQDLIIYQKIQKLRQEKNLHSVKNTLHLAFVEVSRTDLIAGYQGQTALKVKKVIDLAKGGVLFIDEAYSITENDHSDSYGKECLTELTKALEDYREDLVVIVAGYTEPMNKFFESNPGLKSRFNTFIEFDDYNSDELDKILISMCKNNDYTLEEEAKEKIHLYFEKQITLKDKNFANGRLVRNLYDDLVMNHARRVIKIKNPGSLDLSIIKTEDIII